ERPDPDHAGTRQEIHVPARLPNARAADKAQRRGEARVDAVERDEVVEEIVRVVGGDPPRERGPWHPRRLAARDPDLGLEVSSVDDEREVDVQAPRSLHTLATGSCVERADRPDVRPVEQVVLDPNDRVVGLVGKKNGSWLRLITCWSVSTCAKSVLTVTSAVNVGVMPSLASTPPLPPK